MKQSIKLVKRASLFVPHYDSIPIPKHHDLFAAKGKHCQITTRSAIWERALVVNITGEKISINYQSYDKRHRCWMTKREEMSRDEVVRIIVYNQ